jgi:hypothetical protein
MSSWRDFALRGFDPAQRDRMGQVVPTEFAEPIPVSRELKGEG